MQTPRLKGSKRLKDRIRTVGTEKDEKPTYYLTASFARGTSRYHSPQLPLVVQLQEEEAEREDNPSNSLKRLEVLEVAKKSIEDQHNKENKESKTVLEKSQPSTPNALNRVQAQGRIKLLSSENVDHIVHQMHSKNPVSIKRMIAGYGPSSSSDEDSDTEGDDTISLASSGYVDTGYKMDTELTKAVPQEKFLGATKSSLFDWNAAYQPLVDKLKLVDTNSSREEKLEIYQKISHLFANFIDTATTYGKIIIDETFLPGMYLLVGLLSTSTDSEKTIKPVDAGGILGGLKYIAHNIYFKFASDNHGMFDNEEAAQKIAGHEIKSSTKLFDCMNKDLCFAMMILVIYRGFSLIASSLVPLRGESTLVYGTSDAGKTFYNDDSKAAEVMYDTGRRLNLKSHIVGTANHTITISTPADLEVHRGLDGRYYCLDFSRLFPPEAPLVPTHRERGAFLYKLLRPEFVMSYPKPLCSDAFSAFTKRQKDHEEHMKDIKEATEYLHKTVIPEFAQELDDADQTKNYPLVLALHSHVIYAALDDSNGIEGNQCETSWTCQKSCKAKLLEENSIVGNDCTGLQSTAQKVDEAEDERT